MKSIVRLGLVVMAGFGLFLSLSPMSAGAAPGGTSGGGAPAGAVVASGPRSLAPVATAWSVNPATGPAWTHRGGQPGCGAAVVAVPNHSPAYYAAHPDEFLDDPGMPSGMRAELAEIAKAQPTVVTSISCAPGLVRKAAEQSAIANATATNWSGYQTSSASTTDVFVSMEWTVPTVTAVSSNSSVSIWAGLGSGNSASDELVQAGTAQALKPSVSAPYFWYEMYPQENEIKISMSVAAGDDVTILIGFNTSYGTANYCFYNHTKNTYTSVQETLRSGQRFSGKQAEWIVERPSVASPQPLLAKFSTVSATGCAYQYAGQNTTSLASSSNTFPWTMINGSNQTLASPGSQTSGNFKVTWLKGS